MEYWQISIPGQIRNSLLTVADKEQARGPGLCFVVDASQGSGCACSYATEAWN